MEKTDRKEGIYPGNVLMTKKKKCIVIKGWI